MNIKTLDQLIHELNRCGINQKENIYLDTLKSIQIDLREWEKHFIFNEASPSSVCLFSNENFQLILSCWEKDQKGKIHDIDSEEAWIHPIVGCFIEEQYRISSDTKKLEQVSSVILNDQSYVYKQKSKTIYRYINDYENRSACLHLYSKPVLEWRVYDENTGETKTVTHIYENMNDKRSK